MRAPLFLISLLLSSAGCSDAASYGEKTGARETPPAAGAQASASRSPSTPGKPFATEQTLTETGGGTMDFAYSWPGEVTGEAELAALLKSDMERNLAATKEGWKASYSDCPDDAVSCRNYSYANAWKVVANLPRFLSLSSEFSDYTGGAHGNYGMGSKVWDRAGEDLLEPVALFASVAALEKALGKQPCAALDAERKERRGGDFGGAAEEWPNSCPALSEATLLVGSANGKTFDRLGLYYGPYVAGPYAEGAYEIDLPVTAAVLAAVKAEYRAAFSVKR